MSAAPELLLVRQRLASQPLDDPAGEVARAVEPLLRGLPGISGRRVLIAVPSRGIDRMVEVLRAIGGVLRSTGAEPALVPAMGSHGGGTPAGQVRQLRGLGVSEEATSMPLIEPAEYVPVAGYGDGGGIHLPLQAREAAGLVLVNRIKLHTLFSGPVQSGLCKLLAFGLGGPPGAAASHRRAEQVGLFTTLSEALERLLEVTPLLFGVALLEDAMHQLSQVEAVPARGLLEADCRLLPRAAELHPRLPLRSGALLIVETMGKDFSGTGMDPHVIGRPPASADRADFQRIFVRSLSPGSHGNALGIGYADHTLAALVEAMDRSATELNARTSGSLQKARVPQTHATDREAVEAAFHAAGAGPMLQISDTLHVAEALAAGYNPHELSGLEILGSLGPLRFRPDGRLEHLLA